MHMEERTHGGTYTWRRQYMEDQTNKKTNPRGRHTIEGHTHGGRYTPKKHAHGETYARRNLYKEAKYT